MLLTAEMDLSDRRFQRLALTEQAEPVIDDIQSAVRRFQEELLGSFPSEERSRLLSSLIYIINHREE